MRKLVLWVVLGVTLIVANLAIVGKERVLREGRTVLLQLAPRDPRSLLQGDFMALRYVLANEVSRQRSGEASADGWIVVTLDLNDIATFVRFDDGSGVVGGELLLRYRKRGEGVRIASEAFFFEEGQGPFYQSARYGELRVDATGDAVLVRLRDADLRELGPGSAPAPTLEN